MSDSKGAIFLSYAAQDAESARHIFDALSAAGLEVWFDRNELRGGDAWDASIRRQINDCALFVPLISANTNARGEAYFRLEWQLAVERLNRIADDQAFLLPVLIDGTGEASARVPDRFRSRQWTRLTGGASLAAFAQYLGELLSRDRVLPPAPGPSRARHNLPVAVDSFVARSEDIAEVMSRLNDTRLLTLVGVGGTGKTRLALEVAHHLLAAYDDGVLLVELAPLTQAESVPNMVADLAGAVQQPGKNVTQSLVHALQNRSMLLLLDNCEHVLDEVAALAGEITVHCPSVRILATSREGLAIRGEQVYQVRSLTDADGALLLRDRALAAGAAGELNDETLRRLSHRLDGMPLAIELAAARCVSMSPEEVEARLDDRFRLLRGSRRGRLERHQTLRNTVAWSYELLEPLERVVFSRLSVFAGSFGLEAALDIASGDDIDAIDVEDAVAALVSQSMVLTATGAGMTRYRLLETLRQFGEERLLDSGDAERIAARHTDWYAKYMQRAWQGLWGPDDSRWAIAINNEFENLRVAVYAAIDRADSRALTALIKPHLWWAWHALRYEVADWAEAALAVSPEPAFARSVAMHLRFHGGRPDSSIRLAAELARPEDVADPDEACMNAQARWVAAICAGDDSGIDEWMERSRQLAHKAGNIAREAAISSIQVAFKVMAGEMEAARRIAAGSHAKALASGNRTALSWTHFFMGRARSDADSAAALEHFQKAVEVSVACGNQLVRGLAATEAAVVIARSGDPEQGRIQLAEALRSFIASNDLYQLWTSAHHLAYFLNRLGRPDEARRIWRELGLRQGFAARHHRDELEAMLGPAGTARLSDDTFIVEIRSVLKVLDRETGEAAQNRGDNGS
jgi:predicted ATPase